MGTYNLAVVAKKIYQSQSELFSLKKIRDILRIEKESTLFSVISRLLKNEILVKLERGKYILKGAGVHDFSLANFLYQPSYLSFETALNFYGILSQFPYEVTSSTSKKTTRKVINDKSFSYTHIKKDLFWGYEKKDRFLIAFAEKALLDQLYLASKGLKKANLDEYNFSLINKGKFNNYLQKYPKTRQFNKIINSLNRNIK